MIYQFSILHFFRFYIVTGSYQSETIQVNPEQLDVITEEGDRGTTRVILKIMRVVEYLTNNDT